MIREMRVEDAAGVTEVFLTSLGYADSREVVVAQRIAELSEDPRHYLRVWADDDTGDVRGFIHAVRYDTLHDKGGWDVIALAVLPGAQGRGIGRQLLEACEAHVRASGGTFVRLNSRMERTEAHGFYEHLGYACPKVQKYFRKRL